MSISIIGDHTTLKHVGIRPGEKIDEEMISLEESLRTVECERYYMITNKIINQNSWSYNSRDNILERSKVNKFLKDRGVV